MLFFVSDIHFGHSNIIKYSERPFSSVEEMDETIIANWNKKVGKNDQIYCLGDFAFGDGLNNPKKYFDRLNGSKHLVIGNHDIGKTLDLPWASKDLLKEVKFNNQKIVLCHYAMRVWHHSYRGVWHLYGHSHCTLPETNSLSFDAGVDGWQYAPISFDEVKKKMMWKLDNPEYFKRLEDQEVRDREDMMRCAEGARVLNKKFL